MNILVKQFMQVTCTRVFFLGSPSLKKLRLTQGGSGLARDRSVLFSLSQLAISTNADIRASMYDIVRNTLLVSILYCC